MSPGRAAVVEEEGKPKEANSVSVGGNCVVSGSPPLLERERKGGARVIRSSVYQKGTKKRHPFSRVLRGGEEGFQAGQKPSRSRNQTESGGRGLNDTKVWRSRRKEKKQSHKERGHGMEEKKSGSDPGECEEGDGESLRNWRRRVHIYKAGDVEKHPGPQNEMHLRRS